MEQNATPARVTKHLPLGLSIELENGQRGIVRIRETSWDARDRARWREKFPVGWRGQVLALRGPSHSFNEYSIRLVENDPWETSARRIEPGETFSGIVTNVEDFGAFVEIETGITGLLHHKQFPRWVTKKTPEIFWPGDHVRVTVTQVDMEKRHLALELPPPQQGPEPALESAGKNPKTSALQEALANTPRRRQILLVEDNLRQSQEISGMLKQLGQAVEHVTSAEEALELVATLAPEMALVDVSLSNEMNGIELAQQLLENYPAIRIIITTDGARAEQLKAALEDLKAHDATLLLKPIHFEDLLTILSDAPIDASSLPTQKIGIISRYARASRPRAAILGLLRQCREHLGFDAAILFSFDPLHRAVTIFEKYSELVINTQAVTSLKFSPVRDVAEDKDIVLLEDCQPEQEARFRYLLELLPMKACVGVPVPVKLPQQYALFLLHSRARRISGEQRLYVESCALATGAMLEQDTFREQSKLIQRTALIGQMTSSVIHEMNNMLGPLTTNVETLQLNVKELRKTSAESARETAVKSISEDIVEIQANIRRVRETMQTVINLIKKSKNEVLLVEEIVKETIHLIRDISHQAKVVIKFTEPEKMTLIRAQASALEQVLFNLFLNAVQQIAHYRAGQGGWVYAWLEPNCTGDANGMVRICIEDTGPGIHASLWEQVFDAGYTTREEGSGIGLYISRNLVDEMGGKIYIRESNLLGGTTFVVELPCHMAGTK